MTARCRMVLASVLAVVAGLVVAPPARAAGEPVVLEMHGFVASAGCPNARTGFPALDTVLRNHGYGGKVIRVAWLCSDTGDLDVKKFGTAPASSYNASMRFEDIALVLAKAIYGTYSSVGVHVNFVGHSAAGLMMRYALGMVGQPGWPPFLLVDHVVSVSSPFAGWDKNPSLMGVSCGPYLQCQEMKPGSVFVKAMAAMGRPATAWTCIGGSPKDQVSTIASSCGLPADTTVDYFDKTVVNYEHSAYLTDASELTNVRARVNGVDTVGVPHSMVAAWQGLVR